MDRKLLQLLEAINGALGAYLAEANEDRDSAALAAIPADWAGAGEPAAIPFGAGVLTPSPLSPEASRAALSLEHGHPEAPAAGPAVPVPPAAEDLDSAGEAWDPAVHSENKTKTQDGRWRRKRVTKGSAAPAPVSAPIPTPPPAAGPAVPPPPISAPEDLPGVPGPVAVPAPPAPDNPPAPPVDPGAQVMGEVVRDMTAGRLTRDQVMAALSAAGLEDLRGILRCDPAVLGNFRAELARLMQ